MKQIILITLLAFGLQSCMSYKNMYSIIPEDVATAIPKSANKILIGNNYSLIDNYSKSYKTLLSQNYRIDSDNKEMGYISASKKDIGDTHVRLNIVCEQNSIQVTSEWKPGNQSAMMGAALTGISVQYDWENAQWNRQSDKSSIAFANAVLFSKELSNDLKYITSTPEQKEFEKHSDPIYN